MVLALADLNVPERQDSFILTLMAALPVIKRATANATNDSNTTQSIQTDGTSTDSIIACNSISIFACLITLSLYVVLSFNRKYKRLMKRTSLTLAACMASSDMVLHCANLVGYGPLPSGFACEFVGGWLFAAPSLLSIFYSCCIALNSQIVFVFHRRPSPRTLPYYIFIPMAITFILTFTALGTKSYGYDQTWGYCWYSTENVTTSLVLTRILLTYSIPTLLGIIYLILAAVTISLSVFGRFSRLNRSVGSMSNFNTEGRNNGVGTRDERECTGYMSPNFGRSCSLDKDGLSSRPRSSTSPVFSPNKTFYQAHSFPPIPSNAIFQNSNHQRHLSNSLLKRTRDEGDDLPVEGTIPHDDKSPYDVSNITVETQLNPQVKVERKRQGDARKDALMRQLTIRLIGYIVCPILCLLPGIILDLITKAWPDLQVSTGLNGTFDGLNGLIGLFDSLLMFSDPALLAVWDDLGSTAATSGNSWLGKLVLGMKAVFSGDVIENSLEAKRVEDGRRDTGNILASNFGLGARTRMDDVENGEDVDQPEGKTLPPPQLRDIPQSSWASRRRAHSLRNGVEEIPGRRLSEEHAWRTEEQDTRGLGIGNGDLEVAVTIDVTRVSRISRVELMEDWLSGL